MKLRLVAFTTLALVSAVSLGALSGELAEVAPVGSAEASHCEGLKEKLSCVVPHCVPGDLECDYHGPF